MKVTYDNSSKVMKMLIPNEIDHCMVEKIKNKADFEIQKNMPQKVIMDFENVTFMDSAGIGMIIGRYKITKMIGGSLEIINISTPVKKILEMSGVLKIIPTTDKTINKKENIN